MPLALLGFAMIVVFMGLIMAKKLSPFTSLILVPIVFGLLAGYGWGSPEIHPRWRCNTPWTVSKTWPLPSP